MKYETNSRHQPRKAFTLLELMVSSGILAILIVAFGSIISKSQALVAEAQSEQRINSIAMAITYVIKKDINSVAKTGFLALTDPASGGGGTYDTLVFTRTGIFQSIYAPQIKGTGAAVLYKLVENNAPGAKDKVVVRSVQIFYDGTINVPANTDDVEEGTDLTDLAEQDSGQISSTITRLSNNVDRRTDTICIPPNNLLQINPLKNVLVSNCSELSFAPIQSGGAGGGTTRWTYKSNNWPTGIRVLFTVHDPMAPHRSRRFELVCPISR